MAAETIGLNEFGAVASTREIVNDASGLELKLREGSYDYVLQHTFDGAEILKAEGYSVPEGLLELRAFDEGGELHVVMDGCGGLVGGRVRRDGAGEEAEVFDEEHVLWGTGIDESPSNTETAVLVEDRGTRVCLPREVLGESLPGGKRVTLRVRNYLAEEKSDSETGDTTFAFEDWRLVGFQLRDGE